MTDIATREPDALIAGDTWQWRRSLADYPAPTWTLTYYLRGRTHETSFAAAADGSDHLVNVAKATTAAIQPGDYELTGLVGDGSARHTVYRQRFVVRPDPAQLGAGYDPRSHARKVLEAIQAVIEGRATKDQEEYSINNRSLKRTPLEELLKLQQYYLNAVANEDAIAAGGIGGPLGRIRYGVPR